EHIDNEKPPGSHGASSPPESREPIERPVSVAAAAVLTEDFKQPATAAAVCCKRSFGAQPIYCRHHLVRPQARSPPTPQRQSRRRPRPPGTHMPTPGLRAARRPCTGERASSPARST